jgi:two-component system nitrate/nitrite response regulator NarL
VRPGPRPATVRVLTAGRQPLFLDALGRAIRQRAGLQLVAEVTDGRAAIDAIQRRAPDVAVIDLRLAGLDGARVLNAVVRDGLRTRVLIVADVSATRGAYDAVAAGAAGWLSKRADARELCDAVVAIAGGHVAFSADALNAIAAEIRRRERGGRSLLAERERAVLSLVAKGRSALDISAELGLGVPTVKSTLAQIYRRLGVNERAAAVAVAVRRGLID